MNFCPNCGAKVLGRFCHVCGADLESFVSTSTDKAVKKPKKVVSPEKQEEVVATQTVEAPIEQVVYQPVAKPKKVERAKCTEAQAKTFKIMPSILLFAISLLSLFFFIAPVANVLGESLGNLYDFLSGDFASPTVYILSLSFALASMVYAGIMIIMLWKKSSYKYSVIDVFGQLLIFASIVFSIIIMATVKDELTKIGACPILMLVFGLIVLAVSITFTVLEKLAIKQGRLDKGEKPFVVFPEEEPIKPDVVEKPKTFDMKLNRIMKFMKYVGKAVLSVGLGIAVYGSLSIFTGVFGNISMGMGGYDVNYDRIFIIAKVLDFITIGSGLLVFLLNLYSYVKDLIFKPSIPKYKTVARKGSLYVLFFILSYLAVTNLVQRSALSGGYYDDRGRFISGFYITPLGYVCIIMFIFSFVLLILNSIKKKGIKKRFYNENGEQILTLEEFNESVKKEKEEYDVAKKNYMDYKEAFSNYKAQSYCYKLRTKNPEKWQAGKAYSSAGLWFRKHAGILTSITAVAVAIIIGVSLFVELYVNNIFRLNRIEEIELDMSKTQIEEILEPAHFGSDYLFSYYTDEYKEIMDDIQEMSTDLEALFNPSTIEKMAELSQKMKNAKHSFISMQMSLDGKLTDLLYVVDHVESAPATEKTVERAEIIGSNNYTNIDVLKEKGFPVKVYYTDGSYHMHYVPFSQVEVNWPEKINSGSHYSNYRASWTDTFAKVEDVYFYFRG